jgi:hypothetical protein
MGVQPSGHWFTKSFLSVTPYQGFKTLNSSFSAYTYSDWVQGKPFGEARSREACATLDTQARDATSGPARSLPGGQTAGPFPSSSPRLRIGNCCGSRAPSAAAVRGTSGISCCAGSSWCSPPCCAAAGGCAGWGRRRWRSLGTWACWGLERRVKETG